MTAPDAGAAPSGAPASDLGLLRALSGWEAVARHLDRPAVIVPLVVLWCLLATMLGQLEDQLAIMHLPGDRSFRLASLEQAGDALTVVLATWRRWQLGAGPALVAGPNTVITHQLLVNLALPGVTAALLAVVTRRAWVQGAVGFRRQIAAVATASIPGALALVHLRNALVALATSGGLGALGALHLLLALLVAGASVAMVLRVLRPGWGVWPLAATVVGSAAAIAGAAAGALPPCEAAGGATCGSDPGPLVAPALLSAGLLARLLLAGIIAGVVLASVTRIRTWVHAGGLRRWLRAALAVRGQILPVAPVVALPLLGTGDLGLQAQNALSRLLESPLRTALAVGGLIAIMVVLSAFGHRAARSAGSRPPARSPAGPVGPTLDGTLRRSAPEPVPWLVWALAAGTAATALALHLGVDGLVGLKALLVVVATVATLSAPRLVARLRRTRPIVDEAGPEVAAARALVLAAMPLALAALAARLTVTPSTSVAQLSAGTFAVVLGVLAGASYQGRAALAAWFAASGGLVVLAVATLAAAVLAAWGAMAPISFGFALGSMLVLLAAVAVIAVVSGWLVLAGNRLPARGAFAAAGFRRIPLVLVVLSVVQVGHWLDPLPASHDVRTITAGSEPAGDRSVSVASAFERWAAGVERPAAGPAGDPAPVPLVVVATAGGGIKAAYWTTLVLGCLQEGPAAADAGEDGADPPSEQRCPAGATIPRANLFLASGISGGSLGLAADHARHAPRSGSGPAPSYAALLDDGLSRDFLAPDVAAAVLRDAPNSLLHTTAWADRAAVLEDAWALAFARAGGTGPGLDAGFFAAGASGLRFPLLVLNSASVEDRCRIAVTTLDVAPPTGERSCIADPVASGLDPATVMSRTKGVADFVCPGRDLRLSTAALLSARFPFVSPYGQLHPCRADGAGGSPTFAVDGGLVESSGAGPLAEILAELEPSIDAWEQRPENAGRCIAPRLMLIDHGYGLDTRGDPPPAPGQLRAPSAFFSADPAASPAAQQEAVLAFSRFQRRHGCGRGDDPVVSFSLRLQPGQRAPLGWTLSRAASEEITAQLRSDANRCRLVAVRQWFTRTAPPPRPDTASEGCVSGRLRAPAGRPADVSGAELALWERAPGAAEVLAHRTVADASGRFDLPAAVSPGASYSLCLRPGEGADALSRLGERLPGGADPPAPARTPVVLHADRVTRLSDGELARC